MNQGSQEVVVIWRGRQIKVGINLDSNVKEFALKLLKLTKVKADTMRLLIPPSANKGSKLLSPFSAEHSNLRLQEADIFVGKPIRMMGVFEDEVEEVSLNSLKPDLRIIGFDEEEKRMKQRLLSGSSVSLKLPQGTYIFCDFKTLHLPGIELNPPPSEALKRMHMLACDPGIIAIMNKHHWRVGIMTEMAPVGHVGISPKCLLGFNKNQGQEISLRLRTDDFRGFRKYESIKKTLLHELAHMVYSEHDANFFALDKQLNDEAESLDWTKSRGYTLSGKKLSNLDEVEFELDTTSHSTGQKVGGRIMPISARVASVTAAHNRIMNSFPSIGIEKKTKDVEAYVAAKEKGITCSESDLGGGIEMVGGKKDAEPDPDDPLPIQTHEMQIDSPKCHHGDSSDPEQMSGPVPGELAVTGTMPYDEPNPDDSTVNKVSSPVNEFEPDPDDTEYTGNAARMKQIYLGEACSELDPGSLLDSKGFMGPDPDELQKSESGISEPDPDDSTKQTDQELQKIEEPIAEPDPDDCMEESQNQERQRIEDPLAEPDPDDSMRASENEELRRIEDPVAAACRRLQKTIEMLRSEVAPVEAVSSLQTLFKIIRNAIEHPDIAKFRRIRKFNPSFQKSVANYKAAMDLLALVGFSEDVVTDELGRSEAYVVLKRNDPGLLWLAKSSLEASIA